MTVILCCLCVNVVAIRARYQKQWAHGVSKDKYSGRKKNKRMKHAKEKRTSENIEPTRKLCVDALSSLATIVCWRDVVGSCVLAYTTQILNTLFFQDICMLNNNSLKSTLYIEIFFYKIINISYLIENEMILRKIRTIRTITRIYYIFYDHKVFCV